MNKQKIKEFMSAFGECSHEERAKILVEAAKAQRRAINSAICGAQSRELQIRTNELTIAELKEKVQDWNKSYGQLYKDYEEMRQRLQSENDFLTLRVAELEMKLRGNNRVLDANKRGVASWNDSETTNRLTPEINPEEYLLINEIPETGSKIYVSKEPVSDAPENPTNPEQKPIIEQIQGVLDDLEVFHNFYLADVTKAYNDRNLEESEYRAYISASEAEFNTAKSLIKKLLLNTQIIYKKVSKSPYAYTEKLKSE